MYLLPASGSREQHKAEAAQLFAWETCENRRSQSGAVASFGKSKRSTRDEIVKDGKERKPHTTSSSLLGPRRTSERNCSTADFIWQRLASSALSELYRLVITYWGFIDCCLLTHQSRGGNLRTPRSLGVTRSYSRHVDGSQRVSFLLYARLFMD